MLQDFSPLDGALLVDKPAGPTSHDVVDAIRQVKTGNKGGHQDVPVVPVFINSIRLCE